MRIDKRDSYRDESMLVMYEDEPFTGELESKDADGNVVALFTYYEGITHGPQLQWYPDGQKKAEGVSESGSAIGEWRRWHPNGQLAQVKTFDGNGRQLHVTKWDKDGALIEDKQLI